MTEVETKKATEGFRMIQNPSVAFWHNTNSFIRL